MLFIYEVDRSTAIRCGSSLFGDVVVDVDIQTFPLTVLDFLANSYNRYVRTKYPPEYEDHALEAFDLGACLKPLERAHRAGQAPKPLVIGRLDPQTISSALHQMLEWRKETQGIIGERITLLESELGTIFRKGTRDLVGFLRESEPSEPASPHSFEQSPRHCDYVDEIIEEGCALLKTLPPLKDPDDFGTTWELDYTALAASGGHRPNGMTSTIAVHKPRDTPREPWRTKLVVHHLLGDGDLPAVRELGARSAHAKSYYLAALLAHVLRNGHATATLFRILPCDDPEIDPDGVLILPKRQAAEILEAVITRVNMDVSETVDAIEAEIEAQFVKSCAVGSAWFNAQIRDKVCARVDRHLETLHHEQALIAKAAEAAPHLQLIERYSAGVLPVSELTEVLRLEALRPLEGLPRFLRIERKEFRSKHGSLKSEVKEKVELTVEEFEAANKLRALLPVPEFTVTVREQLSSIGEERIKRSALHVVRSFLGRQFTKEVALSN